MAWVKVCDRIVDHRKWIALEVRGDTDAMALWLVGSCRASGTAGLIHDARIGRLVGVGHTRELAAAGALVACGLWDRVAGGYQIHDWEDYQPQETGAERTKRWRVKRAASVTDGDVTVTSRVTRHAVTLGDGSRPVPSRPDPTSPEKRHPIAVGDAAREEPDPLAIRPPYEDRGRLPGGRLTDRTPGVPCPPELRAQLARTLRSLPDPYRLREPESQEGDS